MTKKGLPDQPQQPDGQGQLHQNAENHEGDNNNNNVFDQTFTSEPPPYSSPISNTAIPRRPIRTASSPSASTSATFPLIDFSKYTIPDSLLSKDGSTISTYHPAFSTNPANLVRFIQEQAALPPLPYIHIMGDDNGGMQRDFDIKINMLPMFMNQLAGSNQNRWNYVKLVADGESAYRGKSDAAMSPTVKGGLDEWAKRFCKEGSAVKSFTLTRQLSNWNTSYIEGQIRSLIASTGYNKPITVTFPVKYSKVVVHPPRSNSFNSFFTTLVSPLLDKKRYEVVRAVWPYASLPPGPTTNTNRVPVVQTEEMWWEEWRDVLRWAIVNGASVYLFYS
uniref:Myosin-11 n=1 Tax=Talaromyces marneffei PM1 TaxID=1077442 RepID=A0A093VE54_TALMA